jgi:hypothetical protein
MLPDTVAPAAVSAVIHPPTPSGANRVVAYQVRSDRRVS